MTCKDPDWMSASSYYRLLQASGVNKDTFYPAGTKCYVDPSRSSCFLFGNSGSGVVRKITKEETKKENTQYAYTGPLSMSKSCDNLLILDEKISYGADNPGIFTDAYCYLPWIASEYGMRLPAGYKRPPSCDQSRGERNNINLGDCMGRDTLSSNVEKCDFNYVDGDNNGTKWNKCRLHAEEGYAYNIYTCKVSLKVLIVIRERVGKEKIVYGKPDHKISVFLRQK